MRRSAEISYGLSTICLYLFCSHDASEKCQELALSRFDFGGIVPIVGGMIAAAIPTTVLIVAASTAIAPALADQPAASLPGVTQPEPIVKQLAKPLEQPRKDENGFVRMGSWDVKISGSVTVDISAGTLNTLPR
ncbi:hypothetical protein RB623_02180 [Mesorhizobium sp. LHD-90]|uniref:hypothetical protein n=1 Tax=Mesorhizobium sp. LHD-90 TaxID=3071414 RepID=UPI0027E06D9B|nr:hypothetical protein [Mesorhizobium sp. LHD-90]MDQ6432859.1 hypothetical protein [Mesorhizobium sp. LHD-90]